MTSPAQARPRILAVDDVPANLVALDALLARDYDVIRAASGPIAIQLLKAGPPVDVILMDVQMPVMDGYEAAAAIKKLPGCEDVPLIFVTAVFSEDPHVKRGYAVGGIDYFAKPFDPDVLKMKVAVYASFRRRNLALLERERQVEASEALLQSARRLAALLEALRVGVIIADGAGHLFQVNEEALRLFGSSPGLEAEAYGAIVTWWNEGGRAVAASDAWLGDAVRAGKAVHNTPLQVRGRDGVIRTLSASTSPLRGSGDVLAGGVVVLHDLSEHQKVGAALEHQIARLVSLGAEVQRASPA